MSKLDIGAAMNTLTHGVYVLGVHTAEKDNLMTAAWLCQVSSSPAMLAVAVGSSHLTADMIRDSGAFTVSVLDKDQKEIAVKCGTASGRRTDKIALVDIDYTESGMPIVRGAATQMECRVVDVNTAVGNHIIFIAEVTDAVVNTSLKEVMAYHAKEFF